MAYNDGRSRNSSREFIRSNMMTSGIDSSWDNTARNYRAEQAYLNPSKGMPGASTRVSARSNQGMPSTGISPWITEYQPGSAPGLNRPSAMASGTRFNYNVKPPKEEGRLRGIDNKAMAALGTAVGTLIGKRFLPPEDPGNPDQPEPKELLAIGPGKKNAAIGPAAQPLAIGPGTPTDSGPTPPTDSGPRPMLEITRGNQTRAITRGSQPLAITRGSQPLAIGTGSTPPSTASPTSTAVDIIGRANMFEFGSTRTSTR